MEKKMVKGKEYGGELIFEGEYFNGKRFGKGKEYENGQLKFEGEYLNWRKWNEKKYDSEGSRLLFEGGYLKRE